MAFLLESKGQKDGLWSFGLENNRARDFYGRSDIGLKDCYRSLDESYIH